MIQMHVAELSASPWYWINGDQNIISYSSTLIPEGLTEWRGFLSTSAKPEGETWQRELGSLSTGVTTMGRLRDRACRHYRIEADLDYALNPPVTRETSLGLVQFHCVNPDSWLDANAGVTHWGEPSQWNYQLSGYQCLIVGVLSNVGPGSISCSWIFDGDRAILVSYITNPEVKRASDGRVTKASTLMSGISKFRRSGTSLYFMGRLSYSGHISTPSAVSVLQGIPSTGGTSYGVRYPELSTSLDPETYFEYLVTGIEDRISSTDLELQNHPTDYGDLGVEVSRQLRFVDQNILLLALDVNDWRNFHSLWKNVSNIPGWKKAFEAFSHLGKFDSQKSIPHEAKKIFGPAAATYLFEKYAVLPSVADVGRLLEGFQRLVALKSSMQRLHSRRVTLVDDPLYSTSSHTAVLTVDVGKYPTWFTGRIQELISGLKRWGIYPELVTLADVVPYSFVANWFLRFGDTLKDVDQYLYQKNYFPIDHCVMSEKWVKGTPATAIVQSDSVQGDVEFIYYVRWISRELPLPPVSSPRLSLDGVNHLPEAAALIIQRLK